MYRIVSVEFLAENGFSLHTFPDGKFWVKCFGQDCILHVDEALEKFVESDEGWPTYLTEQEFYDTVVRMNKTN